MENGTSNFGVKVAEGDKDDKNLPEKWTEVENSSSPGTRMPF